MLMSRLSPAICCSCSELTCWVFPAVHSQATAARALELNRVLDGVPSLHVCIEPNRASSVSQHLRDSNAVTVVEANVEEVPLDWWNDVTSSTWSSTRSHTHRLIFWAPCPALSVVCWFWWVYRVDH